MSEYNLSKTLPKAQHRQYYQEFKLNWHKRKHQFAKLHTNSKFGQKKKMPSDDYDPVHQLDSNSETIFLEKGIRYIKWPNNIILQDNWFGISLCKRDKVQIFASIYPVQSVTIGFKKSDCVKTICKKFD